jgi:hypothetical protein
MTAPLEGRAESHPESVQEMEDDRPVMPVRYTFSGCAYGC